MSQSILVNSEICQRCAKCCKEFVIDETLSMALRYSWIRGIKTSFSKEPIWEAKNGIKLHEFVFHEPCKQLKQHSSGKYYCAQYGKLRPDFCESYPDHVFSRVKMSKADLELALRLESKHCPALESYSIEEIIAKLKLEVLP